MNSVDGERDTVRLLTADLLDDKVRLLTFREAANLLNIPFGTLRRMVAEGEFDYVQRSPNARIYIPMSEIRRWVEAHTHNAQETPSAVHGGAPGP